MLSGVLQVWFIASMENSVAGDWETESYNSATATLDLLGLVAFFITGVAYLRWLHLSIRTTRVLGVYRESPSWAVLSWFIPLFNLVKPYRVVRGLWWGLGGSLMRKLLLPGWWAAWIGGKVAAKLSNAGFSAHEHYGELLPILLSMAVGFKFVAEGVTAICALLCVRIVRDIDSAIEARREAAALLARPASPGP
ncbi:DUF4328 domain-containing protein [Myxococcus sp. Y35]|uniref:DUF4328 domain-containing protein n=1 Tax=Pseudomyxococcus flavus TaxID=3115648 RepID=UPI003CEB28F8